MVLKAHIVNGRIVPDEPVSLPEGAAVEVRLGNETGSGGSRRLAELFGKYRSTGGTVEEFLRNKQTEISREESGS